MRPIIAYTKFTLLQAGRIPFVFVSLLFLPTVGMLLFVIPVLGDSPRAATIGTASMCLFEALIICSAQYAVTIADARTKPWGGFVRTLPGGPVPSIVSNILASALYVCAGSLPLIAVAAIGTKASIPLGGLLLGLWALTLGTVPFGLLMVAVGYTVHPAMLGMATSVAPITLAYLGGYFTGPDNTSGFIGTIAPYTPARGPAELVWAAAGDFSPSLTAMVMFPVWTLLFAFLALRAYQGDEGRRFN